MNYKIIKTVFNYIFAFLLAGAGVYGFVFNLEHWGGWVVGSIVYLSVTRLFDFYMEF